MRFLERFLELINEKNVSISDVSKGTNLPRSTVSSYINRKSMPSAIQLEILANYFNVSIDYLVGREDEFGNVSASAGEFLDEEEKELVECFRKLNLFGREAIMIQVKALAEKQSVMVR